MRKKLLSIILVFILILPYSFVSNAISPDEFINVNFYCIDRFNGNAYNMQFGDDGGITYFELDGTYNGSLYTYSMDYDSKVLGFSEDPFDYSYYNYVEDANAFIPQNNIESELGAFGYASCIIHYDTTPTQTQIEEDNIRLKKQYIFNNQPLTREQAYEAVYNYLYSYEDHRYFNISEADDNFVDGMYQIYYRSYTGAEFYYNVNPDTGQVICETLSIPVIDDIPEEYDAGFNAYNFSRGTGDNTFSLQYNASDLLSGLWGSASMGGASYSDGEYNNSYYVIFTDEKAIYYDYTENGFKEIEEHIITSIEEDYDEKVYRIFLDNGICFESNEIIDNTDINVLSYYVVASSWGWMESEYSGSDSIYKISDDIPNLNSEMNESELNDNNNEIIDDSVTADITLRNGNVIVDLNKDMFESDNTVYNYDIAKLAVTLSEAAYDDIFETKNGKYTVNTYKALGFEDENISLYSYPDSPYNVSGKIFEDNTLAFSIANRKLGDKTLLVIDFRGTKPLGDIMEDLKGGLRFSLSRGIYTKDKQFMGTLAWGGFYDFWEDYNIAIDDYYYSHPELKKADEEGNLIVLVTGHSLGAAAANLTGKSLNEGASEFCNLSKDNIYVYTFACPLACLKTTADDNIFNIVNMDDVIPFVPPGYNRYGAKAEVFETGNDFFDGYTLLSNHSCGTYLNAVFNNKVSEKKEPLKKKFRLGAIFCPVDVEIKKDGVVVGKVVNNEVTVCDDDINLEIEENHKFFILPDDDSYTIDINATGDGSMSFYILGSDGENSFMNTYSDISIKGGENFIAEISSSENMNDVSLKYEGEKKTITIPEDTDEQTSGEQFIEIKNKSEKTSVIYWIIGISASFIVLLIILFMLVSKSKKTKKTAISKDNNLAVQNYNEIKNNNEEKVFCTECGKLLSSKQRFCPVCGSKNKLYNGNDK